MEPANNTKLNTLVRHALTHLFIITLGLVMIYPIAWMIVSSFKPNNMIFSDPGLIPKEVTTDNYVTGWEGYAGSSFGVFFKNAFVICALAIVGNLISNVFNKLIKILFKQSSALPFQTLSGS